VLWARSRSARPSAWAPRCSTTSRRCSTTATCPRRSATRAASPQPEKRDEALDVAVQGRRAGRLPARRAHHLRAGPGHHGAFEERRRRGARATASSRATRPRRLVRRDDPCGRGCAPVPHRVDRGRPGRDDWDGWRKLTAELGEKVQLVRRRPVRHQREAPAEGSRGVRHQHPVKVNQIGTLTETLEAIELRGGNGFHEHHQPTAPARRRTRRSPTSPSAVNAGQIRPVDVADRPDRQVQSTDADRGGPRRRARYGREIWPAGGRGVER